MTYNFHDRTGERYGKLTVLERASDAVYPSGKLVRWLCKCDCGTEKIIIGANLAKTYSCGCEAHKNTKLQDITGQRFGSLVVLERAENQVLPSGQSQTMWKCKCDCGSIVVVRGTHLKDGFTKSCGCMKSLGEKRMAEFLSQKHLEYVREFVFEQCVNENGNVLPFDFAIFNKDQLMCVIEYQGIQHYEVPKRAPEFGKLQREITDKIKKQFCKDHNIPLYEIKYNEDIVDKLYEIIFELQDNTVPNFTKVKEV